MNEVHDDPPTTSGSQTGHNLHRPRLVDVATRAGVSTATVSRALSGQRGVSDELAAHVRAVAAELGYVVNVHARTLASGMSSTIGLVVHEIGDPYFSEIASGVLHEASRHRLTVHIAHTGRDPEAELHQLRVLVASGVGAIIIAGSGYLDPDHETELAAVLAGFVQHGGRVSLIGRHGIDHDAVRPDNVAGGRVLTEHLLALGHRRIGVVAGDKPLTVIEDRLRGIDAALQDEGMGLAELPVWKAPFHREGGQRAASEMLQAHPGLSAIIALNDDMAIGVLSELRAHGIAVPGQISVAGFNDVAVAQDLSPSLTTVRFPLSEMGAQALRHAASASPRTRTAPFAPVLAVRDSTGACPDDRRSGRPT